MRVLILCGLAAILLVLPAGSSAQSPAPVPSLDRLREHLTPEFTVWSPTYVMERCAEHAAVVRGLLQKQYAAEPERVAYEMQYLKFISFANLPRRRLPEYVSALFFGVNSASAAPAVYRPIPVPHTDNRIFVLDIRWLYWTPEVFEDISKEDPYFREPIIASDSKGLNYLRTVCQSNAVIRGDWFLHYLGDTSLFLKAVPDVKDADNAFYYRLVYSLGSSLPWKPSSPPKAVEAQPQTETVNQTFTEWVTERVPETRYVRDVLGRSIAQTVYVQRQVPRQVVRPVTRVVTPQAAVVDPVKPAKVVAKIPRTEDEFLRFWGVDEQAARKAGADNFAVQDEGESAVSYHNRVLRRINAPTGVLWETYDVLRTSGDQDFLEALPIPPKNYDAGELIFRSQKGSQFYLLVNGKGERVEFGDPRVVRDGQSGGHVAVTTWKSCVNCHANGIIGIKNEVPLAIQGGADLRAKDPYAAQEIRAAYLKNLQRRIKFDQDEYEEFILDCNGLTGPENAAQFKAARDWYASPLSLEQAAREVGAVDVKEFMDAISIGTKVRVGRLVTDGKPVPRDVWEFGGYAEAALLVTEYRKATDADRAKRGLPPLAAPAIIGK